MVFRLFKSRLGKGVAIVLGLGKEVTMAYWSWLG